MEALIALLGLAGAAALLTPASPVPTEAEYKKALEKLQTTPEDQDANTVVGKYLAFVQGKYEDAMVYLAKSNDKTLRTLAEHERAPLYADTPVQKVGMGDEWVAAAKSFKPLFRTFYDRAAFWYAGAWDGLKNQPLWGDKVRERLQKIYTLVPGGAAPKKQSVPGGWKSVYLDAKIGRVQTAARNGQWSLAITGWKSPLPAYSAIEQAVDAKPGTYKASVWVITDGTNVPDQVLANVQNANGNNVILKGLPISEDSPWWKLYTFDVDVPAGGTKIGIAFNVSSKTGMIYIDDFSIKGPDGKEVLKNSGFEDR